MSDGFVIRLNYVAAGVVSKWYTYLYLYFEERFNELGRVNDLSRSPQGMTDSGAKNTLGSCDVSNFNIVLCISNRTVLNRPS